MDCQVHLENRLTSCDELRPGLPIAAYSRVEVCTGLILKFIGNGLLDNSSGHDLHMTRYYLLKNKNMVRIIFRT